MCVCVCVYWQTRMNASTACVTIQQRASTRSAAIVVCATVDLSQTTTAAKVVHLLLPVLLTTYCDYFCTFDNRRLKAT